MPEISKFYEVTLTVVPSRLCHGIRWKAMLASKQWEFLQFFVYEVFKKHNIQYVIYPEFHKNMNIHIHGIAIVNKINKMDLVDITKHFEALGRSNFKPINDLHNWETYINKDQEELDFQFYKSPNYDTERSECLLSTKLDI